MDESSWKQCGTGARHSHAKTHSYDSYTFTHPWWEGKLTGRMIDPHRSPPRFAKVVLYRWQLMTVMVFFFLCSSRTDFVWRVAWSEAVAGPAREIFKFAIEQSAYTLACNTSEAWAFSVIAQLSLENWHSPLFFERKMPCKHAPNTELKVISSGWICSSEKL